MEKKVTFFIPTLTGGGAERAVSNISMNLSDEIDQEIVLLGKEAKVTYPHSAKIKQLDRIPFTNVFTKLYGLLIRLIRMKKMKKENTDRTVISFLEYPNIINILTKKNEKTIVSIRNHMSTQHSKGLKSKLFNLSIRHLYNRADLVIAVSEEIKRDVVSNYHVNKEKVKVIYNAYPIDKIKELSKQEIDVELQSVFENPVIINVGRFNKQKGQWHLIRAFSKVKIEVPNAKLVLLGDGPLRGYYMKLVKELGIENDVHFLGFQKNPFKYIAKSTVFVLPSIHEGFPNALAEAMACDKPIVSTDCPSGPREILAPKETNKKNIRYTFDKNRYGCLIPVCDGNMYKANEKLTDEETILANTMIQILNDKVLQRYLTNRASMRIRDFDIKNLVKEWQNII